MDIAASRSVPSQRRFFSFLPEHGRLIFFVLVAFTMRNLLWLPEERYLEGKFGDAYLDYKRSVRRWL